MTEESKEPKWIIEPPKADEVLVLVQVGKEAKLTPELKESIEDLSKKVREATEKVEVSRATGTTPHCPPHCDPLRAMPCHWFVYCSIDKRGHKQ